MKNVSEVSVQDVFPFYLNHTLIANRIRDGYTADKVYSENAGRKKSSMIVKYHLHKPISVMDMALTDAVYSLYVQGKRCFSARELLHFMNGSTGSIANKRIEATEAALKRLSETRFGIIFTDEAKKRNLSVTSDMFFSLNQNELEHEEYVINGAFLPLEMQEAASDLKKPPRIRFRIVQPPPLCEYASIVNHQIIQFSPVLLKKIDGLQATERNFLIRYYLIHRIEMFRYQKKKQKPYSISYIHPATRQNVYDSGLLTQLDLKSDQQVYVSEVHKSVLKIMDYFQKIGYIEKYSILIESGRQKAGILLDGIIQDSFSI